MTLETTGGSVHARPGPADDPVLVLSGAPQLILGVFSGKLELTDACALGLELDGDPGVLERITLASAADHPEARAISQSGHG
jgi:hypothetical protein